MFLFFCTLCALYQKRECDQVVRGGRAASTMSGILKRKLDKSPTPYLSSLQGSDDDEVSCGDSGNSSDSLNHPVPSGLLDCTVTHTRLHMNMHMQYATQVT